MCGCVRGSRAISARRKSTFRFRRAAAQPPCAGCWPILPAAGLTLVMLLWLGREHFEVANWAFVVLLAAIEARTRRRWGGAAVGHAGRPQDHPGDGGVRNPGEEQDRQPARGTDRAGVEDRDGCEGTESDERVGHPRADRPCAANALVEGHGGINPHNTSPTPGISWLQRLAGHFERAVWINPDEQGLWDHTYTTRLVRRVFPMFHLSVDGLTEAFRSTYLPPEPLTNAATISESAAIAELKDFIQQVAPGFLLP